MAHVCVSPVFAEEVKTLVKCPFFPLIILAPDDELSTSPAIFYTAICSRIVFCRAAADGGCLYRGPSPTRRRVGKKFLSNVLMTRDDSSPPSLFFYMYTESAIYKFDRYMIRRSPAFSKFKIKIRPERAPFIYTYIKHAKMFQLPPASIINKARRPALVAGGIYFAAKNNIFNTP